MFGFLRNKNRNETRNEIIVVDDSGVRRTLVNGKTESIVWNELNEIKIVTTDNGPLVDDVFWVLIQDEDHGCVIPSESTEINKLIDHVQRLEGFNNAKLIEAMTCTNNAEFVVWKRTK